MKIYMFKKTDVYKLLPNFNSFDPCNWNELKSLPLEVKKLINISKRHDLVFTEYNFMLSFNLEDKEANNKYYVMFIPNPKFNIK